MFVNSVCFMFGYLFSLSVKPSFNSLGRTCERCLDGDGENWWQNDTELMKFPHGISHHPNKGVDIVKV